MRSRRRDGRNRAEGGPTTGHPGEPPPPLPDRPLMPIERKGIGYSELEHWMAHADRVIGDTRQALDALARREGAPGSPRSQAGPPLQSKDPSDDLPGSWLGGNGVDEHE